MSILIKGMEMPKSCWFCNFCRAYFDPNQGYCCDALCADLDKDKIQTERDKGCPLIEIPPHGRLIDGDVAEVIPFTVDDEKGDFADGILYAADWISNIPTIIESEE